MPSMKQITDDRTVLYRVQMGTVAATNVPRKPEDTCLVNNKSRVEIICVPPSSPGIRGKAFLYEDFTPAQLEALTGPQGPAGERGPQGPVSIALGTTTTGEPGSSASVTNVGTAEDVVLNFIIPRGEQGPASVDVGTTTTGLPGTNASVTNSGTTQDVILDFTIPRGDKGETGPGIAQGGTAGQILSKVDGTDYNTQWVNPPENVIESISINGVAQPITNKNVDLPLIPDAFYDAQNNKNVAYMAVDSQFAEQANTAVEASYVLVSGLVGGQDLKEIQYISGTSSTSPAPQGLLKRTGRYDGEIPEWEFDNTAYITSNDVPIQTISNNGIQQTITNHNVDLMIPDAHYDAQNNEIVANSADWANTANSATNATYASYMEYTGLTRGDDLIQIQSISGTSSTSPAPKGLLKRTGRYIPYPIGGGSYPEWVFDDTAYITLNDVPVQSISVNGTTQTITNKNVDITIPTSLSGFTDDLGTHPVHTHDQYTVDSTLASVAKSGSYSDLSGVPTALSDFTDDLGSSPVHTHSQYAESANLASVATSGDYGDLINTPSLASVATSGDYGDLSNVPTKLSDFTDDLGSSPVHTHSQYAESANLATVATSGSYTDLSNTPTIPQPAQSIASGETGYATGDQVYNWTPLNTVRTILIDASGSGSINYNMPSMNVGDVIILIFNAYGTDPIVSGTSVVVKRPTLYFQHDSSRYINGYLFNEDEFYTTSYGDAAVKQWNEGYQFYSSTSNPRWTAKVMSDTSSTVYNPMVFKIMVTRFS